jgi:hypothetical protein
MNDKIKHFIVCLALTLFNAEIAIFGYSVLLPGWQMAVIAGVGKELYDIKRTGFDWKDLIADGAGIVAGLIIRYFM